MKKTVLKIIAYSILIGVIGLCFNMAFGNGTITFIQKEQIYINTNLHWFIWKFDFWYYLENIQLSTTDLSVLIFDLPTRQWVNVTEIADIGNNLLVILDYLIVVINILLYPIKVGAYLIQNILAILGISHNTSPGSNNGLGWLVEFVRNILGNFAIPYL